MIRSRRPAAKTEAAKTAEISRVLAEAERTTHAEGLDGEDDGVGDQIEREEGVDGDGEGVETLLGLGSVAEREDDLQGEEDEV